MNAIKLNYTALANTARECAQLANGVSGTMKWIVAHWNLCCQQSDLLTFTTEARYTRRAALAADMLRMAEQLDRLANDCDAITGEPVEALIVSASNEGVQTTEALNQPEETTMKKINVPASQMEVGKAYKVAGFNTNRAFIKIDAQQAEAISTVFPGVDDTLMILDLSSGKVTHISSDIAMCECASYQTEEEQA